MHTKPREETARVEVGRLLKHRTFYSYYELEGEPQTIGKVARTQRAKRYPLGLRIRYPLNLYAALKYGIRDLPAYEYSVLSGLPPDLRPFLPQDLRLARLESGESVLCAKRAMDFDGNPSRSMHRFGPVRNAPFWEDIQFITETLRRTNVFFMSAFRPGNILVHRLAAERYRPLLWPDVPKCGRSLYPLQLHLLWRPILRMKFERRLRRFLAIHRPANSV